MKAKCASKLLPPPLWGRDKDGYRVQLTTAQIVEGLRMRGGRIWLDNDYQLHYRLPKKDFKRLKALLKERKSCLLQYLLERRPKIEILVACRCDAKPYPHSTHDREDEQSKVRIKGTLLQLRDALACCQSRPGGGWEMGQLFERMKRSWEPK